MLGYASFRKVIGDEEKQGKMRGMPMIVKRRVVVFLLEMRPRRLYVFSVLKNKYVKCVIFLLCYCVGGER